MLTGHPFLEVYTRTLYLSVRRHEEPEGKQRVEQNQDMTLPLLEGAKFHV